MLTLPSPLHRFWGLRFAPPAAPADAEFDPGLHALRGWAAVLVVSHHALAQNPAVSPWLGYFNLARGAVLIFFVISGYVIGLTCQRPFGPGEFRPYWRRRLVRLLPLYLVAVGLSLLPLLLAGPMPPLRDILGNLFFLQNFEPYGSVRVGLLPTNQPLWSLNYELLYYAAFLLVWRFRLRVWPLLFACCALSVLGWILPTGWQFAGSYATGFIFWLGGLALAWFLPAGRAAAFPFLGLLFLLAATEYILPGAVLLAWLGIPLTHQPWMSSLDLAFLPGCWLLVAGATGRMPRPPRLLLGLLVTGLLATMAAVLATGHHPLNDPRWFFGLLYTVVGAVLVWRPVGREWLLALGRFGGLSYAFYLVHQPILSLLGHDQNDGSSPIWLGTRIALGVGAALMLAGLLEHWFQPRAARWLEPLLGGKPRPLPPLPVPVR